MYSDNLVIKLNTIAHQYKDLIDRSLHEILNQPRYRNTGASLATLHVDVIDGNQSKAPQIIITFADSLNILDKRKLQWTKLAPVYDFFEWAETRTLRGPVPGYKNGLAPNLPPWKANERRAWAIAKSKQKFDKWTAKPWRKKGLSNVLKEMNQLVLDSFDKAIEEDLQRSIDAGLRAGANG